MAEGVAVNHLKILIGHSKYELNEVVEGVGSLEWEIFVCCMVLLLAALAIVDNFYIEKRAKNKINYVRNGKKQKDK